MPAGTDPLVSQLLAATVRDASPDAVKARRSQAIQREQQKAANQIQLEEQKKEELARRKTWTNTDIQKYLYHSHLQIIQIELQPFIDRINSTNKKSKVEASLQAYRDLIEKDLNPKNRDVSDGKSPWESGELKALHFNLKGRLAILGRDLSIPRSNIERAQKRSDQAFTVAIILSPFTIGISFFAFIAATAIYNIYSDIKSAKYISKFQKEAKSRIDQAKSTTESVLDKEDLDNVGKDLKNAKREMRISGGLNYNAYNKGAGARTGAIFQPMVSVITKQHEKLLEKFSSQPAAQSANRFAKVGA